MTGDALHILHTVFGYHEFRGQQADIIGHVASGGDALVLMPTGGGKSLCYQVPALLRPGTGVVISPLIALMQDQVAALRQNGVRAAFLNSTLSQDEARRIEAELLASGLDLVYMAPERLVTPRALDLLARARVSLFAIDEAHCVSQWGHDFRPEYTRLDVLAERFPDVPRMALTATADEPTRNDIRERLVLEHARLFVSGFDRPNIRYRIGQFPDPKRQLLDFLRREHPGEAGIVYCLSRGKVDATAEWLVREGIAALPYHAGMPAALRQQNQERFLREEGVVIVATIAFGMGIDKPNVRFVAHLDLPKSVEAYYQETGRAGRDGLPADAWMSYGLQGVLTLRELLERSEADERHKAIERGKLEAMLGLCEIASCRRLALLRYFGEHRCEPCGNCDNCLSPPETWDGTLAAQKALSAAYRTGQRFGVTYLMDLLRGKDSQRIRGFGHEQLQVYGLGKDLSDGEWRSVFRQLVARGMLSVDVEGHGSLRLTEAARPVLRGDEKLELRRDGRPERRTGGEGKGALAGADLALWEALRTWRLNLAREQGVPPYVIFHDSVLLALVRERPDSLARLGQIDGVGERKLAKYGADLLAVLAAVPSAAPDPGGEAGRLPATEARDLTDTLVETLSLAREGLTAEAIAARRGLRPSTIQAQLARLVRLGELALGEVVDLGPEELARVRAAIRESGGGSSLRPAWERLGGTCDWGVLRCVQAQLDLQAERGGD